MDWLIVAFRIVHILSAITWVGGSALFFFYLEPTMTKLGPDAEKFINELMVQRRLPIYFAIASTLAVVGGALLYYHDAGGLQLWTSSTTGVVFTIGATAGILGWLGGNALIPANAMKVQKVLGEMRAAGGPPSAELLGRLHAAQERLRMIGLIDLILVIVAALGMSTARYWV